VSTTMIYAHVLNQGGRGVRSPLGQLAPPISIRWRQIGRKPGARQPCYPDPISGQFLPPVDRKVHDEFHLRMN
jgi:hypothetical protein